MNKFFKMKLIVSLPFMFLSSSLAIPAFAQDTCVSIDIVMKKYHVTEKEEMFSLCSEGYRYSYFKLKAPIEGKKYLVLSAEGGKNKKDICFHEAELIDDADYKDAKASFKAGRDDGVSSLKEVCWF